MRLSKCIAMVLGLCLTLTGCEDSGQSGTMEDTGQTYSISDETTTGDSDTEASESSGKDESGSEETAAYITPENESDEPTEADASEPTESEDAEMVKIKITVGDTEMFATLEDNATTRYLTEQMPMTLSMMDLYGREMCYRYGAYALPTDDMRDDGYEVGDIAYWPPGGSLVILYKQNGEEFERQHLGHIDTGVEIFESTGDTEVTFEVVE